MTREGGRSEGKGRGEERANTEETEGRRKRGVNDRRARERGTEGKQGGRKREGKERRGGGRKY